MKQLMVVVMVLFAVNVYAGNTEIPGNQSQWQAQGQYQNQQATANSSSNSNSSANNAVDVNVKQINQRELLPTPTINPISYYMINNSISLARDLPEYDIPCTPLLQADKVKAVLKVEDGNIFSSIRIEDVDQNIIDGCREVTKKNKNKIKYRVWLKPSSKGAGIGGGATLGYSEVGATSGYSSALGILPGYARSTVDPAFVIMFYEVK